MHEFFDHDVVLACATAGIFVSDPGFIGGCGAVNALAACQIDWLYNNWECELRGSGFKIGYASNNKGSRRRDAESCSECAIFILVVNFEGCRIGIVTGESQFFANIHGAEQGEVIAAGTNRLNALVFGEF